MPILLTCSCGKEFRLGPELAGKSIRCMVCKTVLKVPEPVKDNLGQSARPATGVVPSKSSAQKPRQPCDEDERPLVEADDDVEELEELEEEQDEQPARRMPARGKSDEEELDKLEEANDEPDDRPARRSPARAEDDERRPRKRIKKRRQRSSDSGVLLGMDGFTTVLVGLVVVGLLASLLAIIFQPAFVVPLGLGALALVIGGLWFTIAAFQTDVLQGLLCLFVPFYALIFLLTNFDEAKRPFFLQLVGMALVMISFCAGGVGEAVRRSF